MDHEALETLSEAEHECYWGACLSQIRSNGQLVYIHGDQNFLIVNVVEFYVFLSALKIFSFFHFLLFDDHGVSQLFKLQESLLTLDIPCVRFMIFVVRVVTTVRLRCVLRLQCNLLEDLINILGLLIRDLLFFNLNNRRALWL